MVLEIEPSTNLPKSIVSHMYMPYGARKNSRKQMEQTSEFTFKNERGDVPRTTISAGKVSVSLPRFLSASISPFAGLP